VHLCIKTVGICIIIGRGGWDTFCFIVHIIYDVKQLLLPKEVGLQYRLSVMIPIGLIVLAIHRVCFLSTIAPYIRRDIELKRHNDLKSNDGKSSQQDVSHDRAT
jgi:hypothetical protein